MTFERSTDNNPMFFLARGRSGTEIVSHILERSGIHMGTREFLNDSMDALQFEHRYQRPVVTEHFEPGVGCTVSEELAKDYLYHAEFFHTRDVPKDQLWGAKTCSGEFGHPGYIAAYPDAKYIHMYRDGRDVIISNHGYLNVSPTQVDKEYIENWKYFMLTTFGLSQDINEMPFTVPTGPVEKNSQQFIYKRYWFQAKSWMEHARMMRKLEETGNLSPNVFTLSYEELCDNPVYVVDRLLTFVGAPSPDKGIEYAVDTLHADSIGRWEHHRVPEDEAIHEFMKDELRMLGYE